MLFKVCGPPVADTISNGMLPNLEDTYMPGETLAYTCATSYTTEENLITECQASTFTWSLDVSPPTCRRSKLPSPRILSYWTFTVFNHSFINCEELLLNFTAVWFAFKTFILEIRLT